MKKLTALMLALVLALSCVSAAFAADSKVEVLTYDASLTTVMNDSESIADTSWTKTGYNRALMAVLTLLDMASSCDWFDIDNVNFGAIYVGYYSAADSVYVGFPYGSEIITCSYNPKYSGYVRVQVNLKSTSDFQTVITTSMKNNNVDAIKVDNSDIETVITQLQELLK
ncbi:MAG: hypothetical protein Q4C54_06535 [Clostridia bacterium]|nr:hypothetical protein [Clostridia bacterium]